MNLSPSDKFNMGFYVAGPPSKRRELVLDWRSYFEAYSDGDCCEGEAYLSAFVFDDGLGDYWRGACGPKGYTGAAWAPHITVDIDSPVLADAMNAVRALLAGMEYRYKVNLDAVACFFSGEKGFHILIPTPGLGAAPGTDFPSTVRRFVEIMTQETNCGGCVDFSVFDRQRIIRLPNSRHPRSGLYKVYIPSDELMTLSPAAVRDIARERQCVGWRWAGPGWGAGGLPAVWAAAMRDVETTAKQQPSSVPFRCDDARETLNRLTRQFIVDGAPVGSRAVRLFSAAADIAGLGGTEQIALALLYEAALDSGLCPSEARRQILAGVEHGQKRA